jgi:putative ABC transport system permease protein
VLVLILAIGANTAVFSVIEGVLLRPLPYRDSQRLCVLWKSVPQRNIEWDWTSALTVQDWRQQTSAFEDLAAILRPEGSVVTLRGGAAAEKLQASVVSDNFFDLLGTPALLGHTFSPEEAQPGADVAVLSHGLWLRRFGGSHAVLGKAIHLDSRSVRIIGVMPPSFQFPDKRVELWLLLTADPRWPAFQLPRFRIADAFCALGRLKPGRSVAEAGAEMHAISARLARQYPATDAGLEVRVVPLSEQIAGPQVRRPLWILGAAVLCVLLIACSNLASLLVARSAARRKELAIRAALGAGRRRLVWQLAAESILLSLAGGLGGLALAHAGLRSLLALAPADLPRSQEITINGTVLAFSLGLSLLSGLIVGLLPAFRITGIQAQSGLQGTGRTSTSGPAVRRLRGTLVAVQYGLAIVLLAGAGLLIRSFLLLNAVERGFETNRLLTVSVPLPYEKYREAARGQAFFDEALRRLAALPGVRGAATGSVVLGSFRGNAPNQNLMVEGRPLTPDPVLHGRNIVSENYFRLLGIPLRSGRLFSKEDLAGRPLVAVINQTMARRFWPSQDPIGRRFKQVLPGTGGAWITVIGVVGDVLYSRDGVVLPMFYAPARQWYFSEREVVVRAWADPRALIAPVRQSLQSIDPTLPRFEVATVEDRLEEQDRPRRFQTELIGVFAVMALVLAATGLYGLMANSVEQRSREIGIRVALGATPSGIAGLVLKEALLWCVGGMAIGTAGAALFGRVLAASLYRVAPSDPLTLAAVIALLFLVMLAASLLPALRAGKVDPTVALRHE